MKVAQVMEKSKGTHETKTVNVEEDHRASIVADETAIDESQADDPDHMDEQFFAKPDDAEAHLNSPEFKASLDIVCKAVFRKFGVSPRYGEWEDLRQEVTIKFIPWLHRYKGTATLKTVLNRFAMNLCVDEYRRQDAQIRSHVEVGFDEINLEKLRHPFAEDLDARILYSECRAHLSAENQILFDEFFTEGLRLVDIASKHGFSSQTAMSKMRIIFHQLRQFVEG